MNDQILKRLQDMLKLQSAIIEQLETLAWLTKDIIEDLVIDLSKDMKDSSAQAPEGSGKPEGTGTRLGGDPSGEESKLTGRDPSGCPGP
jgi:hypothetical protein